MKRKEFLATIGAASAGLTSIPYFHLYADDTDSILERIRINRSRLAKQSDIMSIHDIQLPDQKIGQFEKCEIRFQLEATYDNPYDPDDILADGHIRMPSGKEARIPAFYFEPCQPVEGLSQMTMGVQYNRTGNGEWRMRFSGGETGTHTLILEAKEKSGRTVSSDYVQFEITSSSRPGYVQISQNNPLYFENSRDNSLFWGVGTNVAWTRSRSYEYYFGKAKGKMNATRVWLCHWAWLEWTPFNDEPMTNWADYGGVAYYNQMIADTLDRVFSLAEAQNLRIMLVTEDNNEHFDDNSAGGWAGNPYNKIFGGPCNEPHEVFSLTAARSLYRKRLRYILARWGYSDCLWVINSWNDMSNPDAVRVNWIKEMRDYVHSVVDEWRPIVYGSNFRYEATEVTDYAQAGKELVPTKPNVRQEGYHSKSDDWFKHSVLEQTWLGLTRGLAAWMVWPHKQIDRTNSWDVFSPTMKFAATQELNKAGWQPATASVCNVRIDKMNNNSNDELMEFVSLEAYGDVPEWGKRSPINIFEIDLDSVGGQWLEGFSRTLYGKNLEKWRNPPTFVTNLPAAGFITVDFFEIGSGSSQIEIIVNGERAASHTFTDGRRYLNDDEGKITAELPAGEVEIFIDITSGDWARMRAIYISWSMQNPTRLLKTGGQAHAEGGFLYLQNKTFNRIYLEVFKKNPVQLYDLQLSVDKLTQGMYLVKQINPETGKVIRDEKVKAINTTLPVTVPTLEKHTVLAFGKLDFQNFSWWKGICGPAWRKWRNPNGTFFTKGVNSDIEDIRYAGINWVRLKITGGESYNQTIDYKIDTLVNAGLNILVRYHKGTPESTYGTEEQEAKNEAYLRATVKRYKDRVKFWEIHNEPNLQQFWDIGERIGEGSSEPDTPYNTGVRKYVKHLIRSYRAIKSEDPDANVIMGGLSEWHLEPFMDRLKIEGAYEFCDEVAVHPYSRNPGNPKKVLSRLTAFKEKLDEWPIPHNSKPIWITEIGFHTESNWTAPGMVETENVKAQYLTETMNLLKNNLNPLRPIFWYNLHENSSCHNGFGLTQKCIVNGTLQRTPLPALDAYKAIANEL
ncbi:MAG: cellulase family glycosylhydrolase [Bacteroidota bacterium]